MLDPKGLFEVTAKRAGQRNPAKTIIECRRSQVRQWGVRQIARETTTKPEDWYVFSTEELEAHWRVTLKHQPPTHLPRYPHSEDTLHVGKGSVVGQLARNEIARATGTEPEDWTIVNTRCVNPLR